VGELEVPCQRGLNVRVNEQHTVSHVCQKATDVGAEGGFAYAAFGGDNRESEHLILAERG
jgi:hypothetical protein